ncbi:SRPBCC domain-containing protein [Saccharothrix sp. AJ9571]|nr:SRPBCC domain-containing protein [Saccharothrix sp. AJ9571]
MKVRAQDGRLHFERQYGHEVARVWRALTDDAELSAWTPWRVRAETVPGGKVRLAFGKGKPVEGEVLAVEPERRLTWRAFDVLMDWRLREGDGGCLLILETTVKDPGHVSQSAAGFHISLDNLEALLDGREVVKASSPPEEPRFPGLVRHYSEVW